MAYNFFVPNLRKLLTVVFDPTSGHDHDGTNSKSITVGTVAAGGISADATGRAMIANNYFDAATAKNKFAANSMNNAFTDQAFAADAFAADADSRAKFADGIWEIDKLDASSRTHILSIPIENLGAGNDIADRFVFIAPTGFDVMLVSAMLLSNGSSGIADGNTCVITLKNGDDTIVEKIYDTSNAFPAAKEESSLGALDGTHKVLAAGERLLVSVTNGASADLAEFTIQVVYTMAAAA